MVTIGINNMREPIRVAKLNLNSVLDILRYPMLKKLVSFILHIPKGRRQKDSQNALVIHLDRHWCVCLESLRRRHPLDCLCAFIRNPRLGLYCSFILFYMTILYLGNYDSNSALSSSIEARSKTMFPHS